MYNKSLMATAAIALAICLTGCNSTRKTATATTAGVVKTETLGQTKAAISNVLYGEWTAFDVKGKAVTGDDRPYIIFEKNNDNPYLVNCYANNGCNTLNGMMSVTPGGKMQSSSQFASTMRMCPDAPYEIGFTEAINYVDNYTLEKIGSEYLLYLKNAAGQTLMVLRKADAGFMNGAWRVARLGGKDISDNTQMEMVIDIPELKVHGNAPCNVFNGSIFIDPAKQNSIQFRDIATTRMSCPELQLEQELLVALEQVETVVPGHDETAILKDNQGRQLMVLKRINLENAASQEQQ